MKDCAPPVAQDGFFVPSKGDGFRSPSGENVLIFAEESGEKVVSQAEVFFQPLDLQAEGFFAFVLKKVGNGTHDVSSARVGVEHQSRPSHLSKLYSNFG
ncbi:MAG TPA: hypothetical protein VMF69_13290 [Gemmataceae bacterium]|nr:hypothetical protein [Gemmataceae bacterium]